MFNINNGYFFTKKIKDKKSIYKNDKDGSKIKKSKNNTMIHKRTNSNFINNSKSKQKSNTKTKTKLKPSPKSVFMQKITNIIAPSKAIQIMNKQKINLKDRNLSLHIEKKMKNKLNKSKIKNYNNSWFELKKKDIKSDNLENINKLVNQFYDKLVWYISDIEKGFDTYANLKLKINNYFDENTKKFTLQEKSIVNKLKEYFIDLLDNNKTNTKEKNIKQNNKNIQTENLKNRKDLINSIQNYSKKILLKGNKGEYKLENLVNYLIKNNILYLLENVDYEKQKLLRVLVDLFQKQFIYQEIIYILEDEEINLDELYQMAFERLKYEEKESETESNQTNSNLKIDINEIKNQNNIFKEDFINELSESWKKLEQVNNKKENKIKKKLKYSS